MLLSVAGVDIAVHVDDGIMCQEIDDEYRNFSQACPGLPSRNRLQVNAALVPVGSGSATAWKTEPILHDADASWSLFRSNGRYQLCSSCTADGRPYWLAELTPAFRRMTVHCGSGMVNNNVVTNPFRYPLDQMFLMLLLSRNRGAILHTAGFRIGNAGFLCAGVSRAGKSTISRLLDEHTNAEILSDDRMIVRKMGGKFIAFGTPWPGDAGFAVNDGAPLRALLFLRKSDRNEIVPISPAQALDRLLPVTSVPWFDADLTGRILDFCGDLLTHVPAYEFHFTPDANACREIEEFARASG